MKRVILSCLISAVCAATASAQWIAETNSVPISSLRGGFPTSQKKKRNREMMVKRWMGGIRGVGLTLLIAVLFFPAVAVGQPVTIEWGVSGSGCRSGTISTGLDWDYIYAHPEDNYAWTMPSAMEIDLTGKGDIVKFSVSIGIKLEGDPYINLPFSAVAGTSDTHFSFTSELLLINPALIDANGSAWAYPTTANTITAGDFNGKVYRAEYNGGTVFADLSIAPIIFPPGNGYDSVGSTPISGPVSSMQAEWGFTLSANGQASGTSDFTISGTPIPEPASILLLSLGALALFGKRKGVGKGFKPQGCE